MKHLWIVAVMLCLALSVGAWAQVSLELSEFNPRALGMGLTGVGVADDAAAWYQNPAGLAAPNYTAKPGSNWASDIAGAYAGVSDGDMHAFGLNYAGYNPQSRWGVGAGFVNLSEGGPGTLYGAGFGIAPSSRPCTVGVNFLRASGESETLIAFGAMHRFSQQDLPPVRLGLLVDDVTNQIGGPYFSLGVGWPATKQLFVAVDALNITQKDDSDIHLNFGLEYSFGSRDAWRARLGSVDFNNRQMTYGLGYRMDNWRVDLGLVSDEGTLWCLGAGYNF
jgi:hypothetical protein